MSTKAESAPQRLPPQNAVECVRCHNRVHFVTSASRPFSDPHYRLVYLVCPVCGAAATMLREVAPRQRRPRYVYEG